MKTGLLAAFLLVATLFISQAKERSWSGNYTDKKFLKGQAVFQLNILEENGHVSIDFDAAYNDGHACAPEATAQAKVADKNTLGFSFTDTSGNAGTGTIKRSGDGVVISLQITRVADPRCVVFYQKSIPLRPAS